MMKAWTLSSALTLLPCCAFAGAATLSPQSYGAKGDGTTDDTAAVQSAINALQPGGTLEFPSGTYILGALVVKTPNVTLRGHATLKHKAGINAVALNIIADGVQVNELTFDGTAPGQGDGNGNDTIRIGDTAANKGAASAVVRNVTINTSHGNGIVSYFSANGLFEGNHINNVFANGIMCGGPGADGNTIRNNVIDTTKTQNGIFVTASPSSRATTAFISKNFITGNTVLNAGDTGIESGIHTIGTVISNNTVKDSVNPLILTRDSENVQIEGNTVESGATPRRDGIVIYHQTEDPAKWAYHATVTNNTVRGEFFRSAISVGGVFVEASNNKIEAPAGADSMKNSIGIMVAVDGADLVHDLSIRGNTIANYATGINVNYAGKPVTADGVYVQNNIIQGSKVGVASARLTFKRGNMQGNQIQ